MYQKLEKELTLEQVSTNPIKVTCLYFTATWCGPCKMIKPKVKQLGQTHKDDVLFVEIDVDTYDDLSEEAGVSAMPTFVFYKEGAEVDRLTGADEKALEMKLSLFLV